MKKENALPPVQTAIQPAHGIPATHLGLQDPRETRGRFALQSGHRMTLSLPKAPCRHLTGRCFSSRSLGAQPHLGAAGFTVCHRLWEILWTRKEKENPRLLTCFNLTAGEEILLARETLFPELSIRTYESRRSQRNAAIKNPRLKAHFILVLLNPLSLVSLLFYSLLLNCLISDGSEEETKRLLGILSEAKLLSVFMFHHHVGLEVGMHVSHRAHIACSPT